MDKLFSVFNFHALLTKVPHFDLINALNKTIDFAVKGSNEKYNNFSGSTTTWCHKSKHLHFLSKNYL